jgi:predicted NBD/HSP70 family sugar kinase
VSNNSLVVKWAGFDLAGALAIALGAAVRVANDADDQGAGVVTGKGVELVLTLGTGLGSAGSTARPITGSKNGRNGSKNRGTVACSSICARSPAGP